MSTLPVRNVERKQKFTAELPDITVLYRTGMMAKAQEYKNRTLYDVLHSKLKKVHTSMVTVTDDDVKIEPVETHKYLFTTKHLSKLPHGKEDAGR